MTLNEYIKMSYERPNRKVLEGLGASEDLIEYLMETPGNTNWNMIDSITNSDGGGDAEVWFTGSNPTIKPSKATFNLVNVGETDHAAELYNNGANYRVYLNGEELTVYEAELHIWTNTYEPTDSTTEYYGVGIFEVEGGYSPIAMYMNTTAPTSVEVSVKAK